MSDPAQKFSFFLRHWLAKHDDRSGNKLAAALDMMPRSIRKWSGGSHCPKLRELDKIALALGYRDWSKLAVAVEKFFYSGKDSLLQPRRNRVI